jgi:arylsulfatase A-like enzyme
MRRVALALALVCSGCAAPVERPNVLLIVIDTLRRDALGVYGAERATSPTIDALAREGTAFERAYATAPWTKPSVASMLTGQLPSRHGCRHVLGGLAPEADTLAEMLGRHGYARRGVVSHRLVAGRSRLDQGFERYRSDHAARSNTDVSSEGVVAQALEDLDALAREGRPFFLFVHFFDPHARYMRYPAAGFAPAAAGRLDGSETLATLRGLAAELSVEEKALVRAVYLEEARRVDDGLAALFERLRAAGLWDSTGIVLASDHGEELAERGWLEHTRTLYDELVRVPLVVKPPRGRTLRTATDLVSTTDLVPTVLDWTGATTAAVLDGRSLAAGTDPHGEVFAEVDYQALPGDPVGNVALRTVLSRRWKLIEDRASGRLELYDLEADPGERRDLAADQPRSASALATRFRILEDAASGRLPETADPLDDETRDALRSLGYLGGG